MHTPFNCKYIHLTHHLIVLCSSTDHNIHYKEQKDFLLYNVECHIYVIVTPLPIKCPKQQAHPIVVSNQSKKEAIPTQI